MPFHTRRQKSAEEATENYKERTATAGAKWLHGYLNPKKDPKAAMIAAEPRWKAGVAAASAAGKFGKGAAKMDVEESIAIATEVGPDAYQRGTQARVGKVHKKMINIIKAQAAILAHIDGMPTATLAERQARATYYSTEMNKLKGTF